MLNLFTFWVLAPIVVIGYAYAIVSAVRGWHKYAYVPSERYTTLKQHAQKLHDKYQ